MEEKAEQIRARWYVRIDNWHPARLNQLLNCHWAVRSRQKKHDAAIVKLSVLGADVPPADRKRRVSLEIVLGPRQRGGDPDAYWKSLLDALVKAGALRNDAKEWCELGPVTFSRGPRPATVICIENCRLLDKEVAAVSRERKPRLRLLMVS